MSLSASGVLSIFFFFCSFILLYFFQNLHTTFIHYYYSLFSSCHKLKTYQESQALRKPDDECSPAERSVRKRQDLLGARINDYKLFLGSCAACGRELKACVTTATATRHKYCCQFDFDHQDPSQKTATIAHLLTVHASLARIAKELGKCLLLCGDCHMLKTRHRKALTDREEDVFTVLTKGHFRKINPYDGSKSFFTDDEAFLDYRLCVALGGQEERDNPDWRYPDDSFFALSPGQSNNHTSFSQISLRKRSSSPGLLVGWCLTTGGRESKYFLFSKYDGDQKITMGAALVFRNKKRAKGIRYRRVQEDTVRAQMLMAMYDCFRVRHSSPLEKALAAIALS